ncbi:MAG: peptide ABC transporter substrate-binding protein [Anaerolineae bacterium]|nr:peptide ABC transporter substrate-binding protein [Anaerolineae bacterium]
MNSRRLATLIVVVLIVLVGCGELSGNSGPYGVNRDKSVVLASGQPNGLDPATTHSGAGGPIGHIFSGLVTLDTDLQVQPELAAGWTVSDDGTVYTFALHPDARFHDGRPVSADDVIFSWERALNPETGSDTALTYLGDIVGAKALADGMADSLSGVRALNDKTLEVTIDAPKPYFLAKLTFPTAYLVDRKNVTDPDWEHSPNGTGPFRLIRWEDDTVLLLERSDVYYRQPAAVEHVVYLLGAGLPLSMYERGEIDLVGIGGSDLERVRDPNEPLSADLHTIPSFCTTYIGLNTSLPPLDDVRVRQALSYAVDRERLVEGLYKNNALVADGILPPGMPGYGDIDGYEYDPERARALLREAGYEQLPPLVWSSAGYDTAGAIESAVISMWEETLGADITVELIDPYAYLEELYAGNIGHFYTSGWCADYADPENFLDVLFHSDAPSNNTGFSDPEIDAALEAARVEPDPAMRMALYADIEQQLVDAAPRIMLVHGLDAVLMSPRLQGLELTPISVPQWHRVTPSP